MKALFKNFLVFASLFTVISLLVAPLVPASAMVREWDSHFDQGGVAIYDGVVGNVYDPKDIAVQEDGKIVEVMTASSANSSLIVLRYNTNGTLDDTFGTGGVFTYSESASDEGYGVAIDGESGSIFVTGRTTSALGDYDMLLLKLNGMGELDATFGTGGVYTRDIEGDADIGNKVEIQGNGKIVVSGSSTNASAHTSMTVYRVNADGTTDTNFGSAIGPGQYVFIHDAGYNTRYVTCLDMSFDVYGNILVYGQARSIMPNRITSILWRVTPAGQRDSEFNPLVETPGGVGYIIEDSKYAGGITVLSDGSIVTTSYGSPNAYVAKYDSNGAIDALFGTGGTVAFADELAIDVLATYRDNILLLTSPYDYSSVVLRRLSSDGAVDSTFAGADSVTYSIVTYNEILCTSLKEYRSTGNVYMPCRGQEVLDGDYDSLLLDYESAYQISGLPANLKAARGDGYNIGLGSLYGLVGSNVLMLGTNLDEYPLAILSAIFDHDLDWSNVSGDVDWVNRKSVTAGLDPQLNVIAPTTYEFQGNRLSADGVDSGYFFIVPKGADDTTLRICPDVTTLAEVTVTCANGEEHHEGDTGIYVTSINGRSYWIFPVLSGYALTGVGGISFNTALAETGTSLGVPFVVGAILCVFAAKKKYQTI